MPNVVPVIGSRSQRRTKKGGAFCTEATMEVVAPDLAMVGRVWLGPGQQRSVSVPSEASFLRIHLTSGEIVTLQDPGNLDRVISKAALTDQLERAPSGGVKDLAHVRRQSK